MSGFERFEVDLEALRNLYGDSHPARTIMDRLATRGKNSKATTVDRLSHVLASSGTSLSRGEIIEFMRKLEEDVRCGIFRTGRRGKPSRFEWKEGLSMISLARAAAGETSEAEAISLGDMEEEDEAEEMIDHSFPLRPGLRTSVGLPLNLTKAEAARLARFLEALPFE